MNRIDVLSPMIGVRNAIPPRNSRIMMIRIRNGKARNRSVTRIMRSSNFPPRRPANAPTIGADQDGQDRRGDADEHRRADPVQESRVHVAPDVVGAEPGDVLRWHEDVVAFVDGDHLLVDAVAGGDRRGDRHEHHDRQDDRGDRRTLVTPISPPCHAARRHGCRQGVVLRRVGSQMFGDFGCGQVR